MKAVQIVKPGEVRVIEIEKPVPGAGEILLKILYVGFCGSDLSTYLGKNPLVTYPRIPGHEIAAIIESKGPDIPDHIHVGRRVTVVPYTHCGHCAACKRGRFNACEHNQTLGVQRDGAMAEYITVPWEKILNVPELPDIEQALIEPLTVGFHAIDRGRVTTQDVVMVLGCGMIGTGAIAGAAHLGATVIAVDIDDNKLMMARKLGAKFTINTLKDNLHEALHNFLHGISPDVVVEAAGNPLTYKMAIEEVAFTGRVVCIGYAKEDILFATRLWVQKELDICGSRNALPENFKQVVTYLKKGYFPIDSIISKVVTPEEVSLAFSEWADNPAPVFKILLKLV